MIITKKGAASPATPFSVSLGTVLYDTLPYASMNSTPMVFGPQWEDTVHPAFVR